MPSARRREEDDDEGRNSGPPDDDALPDHEATVDTLRVRQEKLLAMTPLQRLRIYTWELFDNPNESPTPRLANTVMWTILFTILVSVITFLVSSLPRGGCTYDDMGERVCPKAHGERLQTEKSIEGLEMACVMIFSLEYVLRLASCAMVMPYHAFVLAPMNLVDLLSIVPWYINLIFDAVGVGGDPRFLAVLRVIRLVRVVRVFKVSRSFDGMIVLVNTCRRSLSAMVIMFATVGVFALLFGTLIYMAEGGTFEESPDHPPLGQYVRKDGVETPFLSIPVAMYWCIVTMTTVGYGDMYPISGAGYAIASLTILAGVVTLALPITIIGANFDEEAREAKRLRAAEKRRQKQRLAVKGEEEIYDPSVFQGVDSPTDLTTSLERADQALNERSPAPAAVRKAAGRVGTSATAAVTSVAESGVDALGKVRHAAMASNTMEKMAHAAHDEPIDVDLLLHEHNDEMYKSLYLELTKMHRQLAEHTRRVLLAAAGTAGQDASPDAWRRDAPQSPRAQWRSESCAS